MKAIKLTDLDFEVIDVGEYPHLKEILGSYFDIAFLNGPIGLHPKQVLVGICVDDEGLRKGLKMNRLATSLAGVFRLSDTPLVGPVAVVVASDYEGESIDVPDWAIKLVTTIKECIHAAAPDAGSPEAN